MTVPPQARIAELETQIAGLREQLDMAQDFGRIAVWERHVASGAGRWDDHVFRLFGFEPHAGAPSFEAATARIHPADRDHVRRAFDASTLIAGRYEAYYRVVRPDTSTVLIHSIWEVKNGADGRPERALGVMVDDTRSMQLADRYRISSTQLELAASLIGLSLWRTDLATQRVHGTGDAWRDTGIEPREEGVPAALLRATLHPDDLPAVDRATEQALATREVVDVEARHRRADGGYAIMMTRRIAQRDEAGRPVAVLGIGLDITERRLAELELREAQQRASMSAQAAGLGTWQLALVDGIAHWSWDEQMYRLRGLEPDDPRPIDELVRDVPRGGYGRHVEERLARAMASGDAYVNEFRVAWPDGSERWLASRGMVVNARDGAPDRMFGVNWDVTEQKLAEQRLRDKAAAEQASRAKSEFLARMSHELRTPMNAVLGFAQLLAGDPRSRLDATQRQRVDHIRSAGEHLLALIDDVLDLAGIEAGREAPEAAPVALDPLLEDLRRWFGPQAQAAGVTLELRGGAAHASGDERRLRQVFGNLLSNAIKYNRRGGRVRIATVAHDDAGGCVVSVADTGRGLSAEQLGALFQPFNRLGAEREGIEGTGIGLTIVRQLLDRMGGRIEVQSVPGEGSEFRVWLPAASGEAPPRRAPAPPPAPVPCAATDGAPLELLYVEDNPVNLLLVQELVALCPQVRMHGAANGSEGVASALRLRPGVVLIDMQLPDFDGFEVLRRLRAEPALAATRCIALSANAMLADVARARAAGFDDYWTKPIDFGRFLAALRQLAGAA